MYKVSFLLHMASFDLAFFMATLRGSSRRRQGFGDRLTEVSQQYQLQCSGTIWLS